MIVEQIHLAHIILTGQQVHFLDQTILENILRGN